MKTLTKLLGAAAVLLALNTWAQPWLSVQVDTNGILVWPTNFFAGNGVVQTNNGYAFVSDVQAATNTLKQYIDGSTNLLATATRVESVAIPMGAWFTNFVPDGGQITAATAYPTNSGDGWSFADAATNVVRSRFSLPWNWNLGAVKVQLQSFYAGVSTNATTNVVWRVRAAGVANGDPAAPTLGTPLLTTNVTAGRAGLLSSVITVPYIIDMTAGDPSLHSIIWEVGREGGMLGDTLTNALPVLSEVRIFYAVTNRADWPTSTP